MALTKEEVRHVAKLARLTLSDEEVDRFTVQIEGVFTHLDKLAQVNTDGVEESAQVTGLSNVTRNDLVTPSLNREDLLAVSQREKSRGMIKVRKSI